jgi:hypothetical protein
MLEGSAYVYELVRFCTGYVSPFNRTMGVYMVNTSDYEY